MRNQNKINNLHFIKLKPQINQYKLFLKNNTLNISHLNCKNLPISKLLQDTIPYLLMIKEKNKPASKLNVTVLSKYEQIKSEKYLSLKMSNQKFKKNLIKKLIFKISKCSKFLEKEGLELFI